MLKIQAIGHLGADVKEINSGKGSFLSFSVGVSITKEKTQWIECTKNFSAEKGTPKIAGYLKKGQQVFIEGTPYAKAYTSEGKTEPGATLAMFVDSIELLGGK